MTQFCVIHVHPSTADQWVNGPFLTREAAQKWAKAAADVEAEVLRAEPDNTATWVVDSEDLDCVSVHTAVDVGEGCAFGEVEHEFNVFTMIAPEPEGGPE